MKTAQNKTQLQVALIGYGAMGREVEDYALEQNAVVVARYDEENLITNAKELNADVLIDFSHSSALVDNVKQAVRFGLPIVIGTTGWNANRTEVQRIVVEGGIGAVFGSNFSVGMQLFFRIVERASVLLNNAADYDVAVQETHHSRKADSPSGTALSLGKILLNSIERKRTLMTEAPRQAVSPEMLHVASLRCGDIAGTHTIIADSLSDTIELTHRAKNRSGFAIGALLAAHWIVGKTGFIPAEVMFDELFTNEHQENL